MNRKSFYIILPWIYLLTVITLLVIPTSGKIKLNEYFLGIRTDHFIHAILFFPSAILFYARAVVLKRELRLIKSLIVGILFCAFCESLHYILPYRSFDPADFVANAVGMSVGFFIILFKPFYAFLRQTV